MTASSFGDLLVRAVDMSGEPLPAVFPLLPTVVFHTHLGHVWLIRFVVSLLLLALVGAGGRRRDSRNFQYILLGILLSIAVTSSATGHAADAGDFSIPELIDGSHLLAALVWGGGLSVLWLVILPDLARQGDEMLPQLSRVAGRFSRIAGFAVLVIALSAGYNATAQVGSFDALLQAPYGRIILVKSYLFFLLLMLGAFNRYGILPLLGKGEGALTGASGNFGKFMAICFAPILYGMDVRQVVLRFRRNVRLEAILVAGVLLCAVALRHQMPARHFPITPAPQSGGAEDHQHHGAPK